MRAAIVGLGGVGNSQLAFQYCHDVRQASPQTWVFWVHASTAARFEEEYRGIADRLELPGRSGPETNTLKLVKDWLCDEGNGSWTMVLDNADDVDVFYPRQNMGQGQHSSNLMAREERGYGYGFRVDKAETRHIERA